MGEDQEGLGDNFQQRAKRGKEGSHMKRGERGERGEVSAQNGKPKALSSALARSGVIIRRVHI